MRVVLAGEMPLVAEVGERCVTAGHDTTIFLVEDLAAAADGEGLAGPTAAADVIIEMQDESAVAKERLLANLTRVAPLETLVMASALATSTTEAASWVPEPERVVGFGLLSPLGENGIVELAAGLATAVDRLKEAATFWAGLGFEAVTVADGPGLVRARTICCLINEAVSALMEGVATAADIDQAMKLGTNYPHGPLEWADHLGLDIVLGVMTGLHQEWGEDRYRPAPLLRRMVLAGKLGQKSGEGFYRYD